MGKNRLCRRAAILCACTATLLIAAPAAKAATDDNGVWMGVFANGKLPPSLNDQTGSWRLWLDTQLRWGDDASRLSQGVARAGVGYELSKAWSLWGGYAYIRTDPPYAAQRTKEQRIWEQAIWNGAIGPSKLSSRTRLEQRFFNGGTDTGGRLRESIKLVQPLDAENAWSLVVSTRSQTRRCTRDQTMLGLSRISTSIKSVVWEIQLRPPLPIQSRSYQLASTRHISLG